MRLYGSRVPLIAMSGYSAHETKVSAQLAGLDEFRVKPVALRSLLDRLVAAAAASSGC